MPQQEEDPSHYTRTLVVKPALSQMYDQLLATSKSLETACKNHCTHTSAHPVMWVYLDLGISQTAECYHGVWSTNVQEGRFCQASWCHYACSTLTQNPRSPKGEMWRSRMSLFVKLCTRSSKIVCGLLVIVCWLSRSGWTVYIVYFYTCDRKERNGTNLIYPLGVPFFFFQLWAQISNLSSVSFHFVRFQVHRSLPPASPNDDFW